jgi:hypothetical protein
MSVSAPAERTAQRQATPIPTAELRGTTSIEAASARLGIGRGLGHELARAGRFPVPVIRAGRRLLVPIAPLERLLNGQEHGSPGSPDLATQCDARG